MNACMAPVWSHAVHLCLLLQGDGTGVSEDHSKATSSSATAAVNQRDDTAVSSSYSGSSIDEDCSAPLTPPSFTRVGGAPHWGETSAGTDLSYIHSQTAKYLMKATVRPKEKVGWAGGAGEGAPLASVKHNAHTVVLLVRPLPAADGNWVKVMMVVCSSLPRIIIHFPALLATVYVLLYMYGHKHIL